MNVNAALLKFCIEHSDAPNLKETKPPNRDPADYKWLREALDNLETDAEKMKKLLKIITDPQSDRNKIIYSMEELQFYIEDLDNANDLDKIGGIVPIIAKLDDSDSEIRYWAAYLLVTVVQNNPRGQTTVLERGALPKLVLLLESETNNEVLCKILSILSGLLRDHKLAQTKCIEAGVLERVINILERDNVNSKTKMRVVLVLRHWFGHTGHKESLRNENLMKRFASFLSDDDNSLREQTLQTLGEFVNEDSSILHLCNSISLKSIVEAHENKLKNLPLEQRQEHETEIDLCSNLLNALNK